MQIIEVTLVSIGSLFMVAAILSAHKTKAHVPPDKSLKWITLSVLMMFFLFGYLTIIFVKVYNLSFPFELFVSSIFFAGGLFVLLVISLSKTTIIKLNNHARELDEINHNLDTLVQERTSELEARQEELHDRNLQLEMAYSDLKTAQSQTVQQEKMATIGQLAAGVAHEINNPMGFISSNLRSLEKYLDAYNDFIKTQEEALQSFKMDSNVEERKKKLKIDFIVEDAKDLIAESLDGASRVSEIVQNLKTFARVDEAKNKDVDINECLTSTLKIIWNELKYTATLVEDYGNLPQIKGNPQELSQVFMNLMINASHAIDTQGEIKVKTWQEDEFLFIAISDTGKGIPTDHLSRLFEPFFTTKDVGKGTGLGLSISYEIIKKHGGEIIVDTEVGQGSTFTVQLPLEFSEKQ